eukprot:3737641-Rhodomonas_salina.3
MTRESSPLRGKAENGEGNPSMKNGDGGDFTIGACFGTSHRSLYYYEFCKRCHESTFLARALGICSAGFWKAGQAALRINRDVIQAGWCNCPMTVISIKFLGKMRVEAVTCCRKGGLTIRGDGKLPQ